MIWGKSMIIIIFIGVEVVVNDTQKHNLYLHHKTYNR
jgi:hypothetical protein